MKHLFTLLCLGLAASAFADDFYRTFYNESLTDGPYAKMKEWEGLNTTEIKARVEEAYGAKIVFLPYDNERKPKASEIQTVNDWFLISSWDDVPWVKVPEGKDLEQNFSNLEEKLLKRLRRTFPKIESLADKFDEYNFITTFFPEVAPPKMQVAIDFKDGDETAAEVDLIERKVDEVMSAKHLDDKKLRKDLIQLELVRTRINSQLGFSVLKNRSMNHSEGRLPKTKKDWVELYANYVASKEKQKTDKFLASDKGGFAVYLLELNYPEGYALETLLRRPNEIVVQKMVDLQREVRMHIVRGKILKGATFLRFYNLNEYLPQEDLEMMEAAVEKNLLSKLPPEEREHLYASPDVYLTKSDVTDGYPSRRVLIGDFNDDIDSGYLEPTEDAITTNLFAAEFRGPDNLPPYLATLNAFRALPITHDQKLPSLLYFLKRSVPFMEGDVLQAYFDRIGDNYLELLAQAKDDRQRAKEYDLALRHLLHFKEVGPKFLHITGAERQTFLEDYQYALLQFISHFQDLYPGVRAPVQTMEYLRDHLKGMSADVEVVLEGKAKIVAKERATSLTTRELKALRKEMRKHIRAAKVKSRKYRLMN